MADQEFLRVAIDTLTSLIKSEVGLVTGARKEMKKLSSTLTTIQAVIKDAEDKQFESEQIRDWLRKLSNLAFEIDDILDEWAIQFSKPGRRSSILSRYSLKNILFRSKIGRRMKQVADELDAVAAERTNLHLREMAIEKPSNVGVGRETGSILNEPHDVYGRDGDKDKIVNILVNDVKDCQQLSVLPITGIGGLGKTTLAQLVYNDQRVTEHFDIKLWVCVSDNFDLKTLIKMIIESAAKGEKAPDLLNLDSLQHRLLDLLNQKRYLLILDDTWNEDQEKWAMLKSVLTCGSRGASIVVTTRLKKVADIMGTLPAHCLTELSEEHCWLLFRRRAFVQEREEYPDLEAIGRQIVKKCAGVPLAAKALGGLLRFKRTENDWLYVQKSEIWDLPQQETSILPALRLSYLHLPSQLRQCFAYCAVFPKDIVMEKEDLIFRWMAYGYISSNGILETEDVGNEVWNELVLRSLFEDVRITDGGHTYFKMHDLVHDLAQSIIKNKVPGAQAESNNGSASNSKIRQVRIDSETDMFSSLMNFSRLRMLDASRIGVEYLPSALGNLKHIRYLNLSYSKFPSLPNTICGLWNLKILKLNFCTKLVSLPKHMRCLSNLRHLFLKYCPSLDQMPPKIGELTSLKTLSMFIVGHKKDNQLGELQCLNLGGELEIRHLERVKNTMDAKKASLGEKPNLRGLYLQWKGDSTSESLQENMDEKVLEALEPHLNLKSLSISGFKGRHILLWKRVENIENIFLSDCPNCSSLPPLGELPRLKTLELRNFVALEYIVEDEVQGRINPSNTTFPSLEELELRSLPNLKGLLKEEVGEVFPNLRMLRIHDCSLLVLPPLSSLKDLTARGCSHLNLVSFSKLVNLTSLELEIDKNMTTCMPNEILENLSNLELLSISSAHQQFLPVEGLGGLKYLKELKIISSETSPCFGEGWLQHLTTLETLRIIRCPEVVELAEEIKYLHSLNHLILSHLPKMVCQPEVLQHLPSLQSLTLSSLDQLASPLEWLGNCKSLEYLLMYNCPRVASLPASIQGLTNLQTLSIEKCPELKRRCEKGRGEDWHKIAHIPNVSIDDG